MGCNCGSGSGGAVASAGGGAYVWEWTDLSGEKHQYDTDVEAFKKRAEFGGSVTPVLRTQ